MLELLDVQSGFPVEVHQGRYRKVAQMLVIHGVEFPALEQISEVRHLDRADAAIAENVATADQKIGRLIHMGKYVVPDHDARGPVALPHAAAAVRVEEFVDGIDPRGGSDLCDVRGGLDSGRAAFKESVGGPPRLGARRCFRNVYIQRRADSSRFWHINR